MTKEEAIYLLQNVFKQSLEGKYREAFDLAINSLRPVSREQVERMRGKWEKHFAPSCYDYWSCTKCHSNFVHDPKPWNFCPVCMAPMTDEAVEMVIERLEVLHGETETD